MLAFVLAWAAIVALVFFGFGVERWWSLTLMFVLAPFVIRACDGSENYREYSRKSAAAEAAAYKAKITPRTVSTSPDGCTVYVFTTDRDHYFTRCGGTVVTETMWKESCGKNCSREKSDVITTEGNK